MKKKRFSFFSTYFPIQDHPYVTQTVSIYLTDLRIRLSQKKKTKSQIRRVPCLHLRPKLSLTLCTVLIILALKRDRYIRRNFKFNVPKTRAKVKLKNSPLPSGGSFFQTTVHCTLFDVTNNSQVSSNTATRNHTVLTAKSPFTG